LHYLDTGTKRPPKFAHVVIHHGAISEPIIKDYLVGPLPLSEDTTMRQLTETYHHPDIPHNGMLAPSLEQFDVYLMETGNVSARAFHPNDDKTVAKFVQSTLADLGPVTLDLFGAESNGYANDTLVPVGGA
jgi:primary-amine oxidase